MSVLSEFQKLLGVRLVGVRRILYVHQGVIQGHAGPLELTFQNGTSIVLDAGGDGETLVHSIGAWTDPFREPLSDENRRFVEASGKWSGFKATPSDPLDRAVGQELTWIAEVRSPSNKLTGVVLQLGKIAVRADVDSDELFVNVA